MKIKKESQQLVSLYNKESINFNHKRETTNKTKNILNEFYDDFKRATKYINELDMSFVSLSIKNIQNIRDIPRPISFPQNSIPSSIMQHIDSQMKSYYKYTVELYERKITMIFITELTNPEKYVKIYNSYFMRVLVWLYIIDKYSTDNCAEELTIYLYHTSLKKLLPLVSGEILSEVNVNTAFTTTCPIKSEIVIFRKEEWFKVLIHETMHNFGLDFSGMNTSNCTEMILTKFKVNSDVNLYEAYTEYWARIMNIVYVSFIESITKEQYITNINKLINIEIWFSCVQMLKILKYMNLGFVSLFKEKDAKNKFKEGSSILSYYILTFILIYNWQNTLEWCDTHNTEPIAFKKTHENMNDFCKYILLNAENQELLNYINNIGIEPIPNSLRMSAIELE